MSKIKEQEEMQALRNRVAELEAETKESNDNRYFKEIQSLRDSTRNHIGNVQIKPIQDHKRISLWHVSGHNIGKRVGPLHPGSAEDTFAMFARNGIKLSLTKPTEQEIAKYKETKEYKAAEEKEIKRRTAKNKSKKESEISKLTQAISKMSGIRQEGIVSIKDESQVKVGR